MILSYFMVIALAHMASTGASTWVKAGDRLLKYYPTPKTWADAAQTCVGQGGILVIDDFPDVTSYLRSIGNQLWIGATDTGHEGQWKWVNGLSVKNNKKNSHWSSNNPDNYRGIQNCAVINWPTNGNGRWDDRDCNSKLPFACQAVGHPVDTWDRVGGRFLKYHGTAKTWPEALSTCLLEGSTLVIDDDPNIHYYLLKKANGKLNIWIGATDLGHEGRWVWVNGGLVGHGHGTYWLKGQPSNSRGKEGCAHIHRGGWNDNQCTVKFTFFCQIQP
jgi:hypothetical protein